MGVRLSVKSSLSDFNDSEVMYEFNAKEAIRIGRAQDMDIQLPHPTVSGIHATLLPSGTSFLLQDEGSTNGTSINGHLLFPGQQQALHAGDEITVGGFSLYFQTSEEEFSVDAAERTRSVAREILRQVSEVEGKQIKEPRFVVIQGKESGKAFPITKSREPRIGGRDEQNDFHIDDSDVSRAHFEIRRTVEGTYIVDLSSKNGILVNQQKVKEALLVHNDEVQVGETIMKYDDPAHEALEKIEKQEDEVTNVPISSNKAIIQQKNTEQEMVSHPRMMEADNSQEKSASFKQRNESESSFDATIESPIESKHENPHQTSVKNPYNLRRLFLWFDPGLPLQKSDFFVLLLVVLICILSLSGLFILMN